MRWDRQEYIDLVTFGQSKRPMFTELFGPLIGLEEEWRAQGASAEELDLSAFDFDYVDHVEFGGSAEIISGMEPKVLEDTPEYTISTDSYGRTVKLIKSSATIPLPMDYPVKNMDDWLKMKHMFTFREDRINWEQVEQAKRLQEKGYLVWAPLPGGFDLPRQLLGEENVCICYYDEPELMQDIMSTLTDTAVKVIERIGEKVKIDNLAVHEDMAGKSGPMIGPALIDEFIKPYYTAIWDAAKNYGAKIFSQDSDGNMNAVIDSFLDCGVNLFYPCEPAAGMDVVQLREKYGERAAFKGGIDKHILRQSKEDIRKEVLYKTQLKEGVIFGLDHRIPNGTPLEHYRYYVDLMREVLGIPKRNSEKNAAFVRMAF